MKQLYQQITAVLIVGLLGHSAAMAQTGTGVKGDYQCVAPGRHTYTFDGMVPGVTYRWIIPAGWSVLSGGEPNSSSVVVSIPSFQSTNTTCPSTTAAISVEGTYPQIYTLPIQLQLKPEAIGPTPTQNGSRFNVAAGGVYSVGFSNSNCYPASTTFNISTNSQYFTLVGNDLYVNSNVPNGTLGSIVFTATTPDGCTTLRSYQVYNPTNTPGDGPAPLRTSSREIALYPNPITSATRLVQIAVPEEGAYTAQFINPYGQTVLTQEFKGTEATFDTSTLRKGIYSVVLVRAGKRLVKSLMVE